MSIDGIGIALIALASAALEISLDRGQIDDWFGSGFITTMILIAVFGWIGTVVWELYIKEPIIDFRLLNNRNFAIASGLFFVFGVGLFGTTTLIPQLLQSLYGYRAIDAGLVLYPGALVITCLAPISAQLLQRNIVSAKTLVLMSLAAVAAAMFLFSNMNLDTDGGHFRWIRSMQGFGYGLFLVPVNLIAYSQLRPDQNNKASSLTNLFRNWGGSFGIAFVTTAAERRAELHQLNLGSQRRKQFPGAAGKQRGIDPTTHATRLHQRRRRNGHAGNCLPRTITPERVPRLHGLLPGVCLVEPCHDSRGATGSPLQGGRSTNCRALSGIQGHGHFTVREQSAATSWCNKRPR